MEKLRSYLLLIRIPQWSKNLFIFLPAFFALKLLQADVIYSLGLTFIGFSFLASAVYVFNDMLDIESDKIHPTKRNRPLASGKVTVKEGIFLIVLLLILASAVFIVLGNVTVMVIAGIYLIQNILYTIKLKHISLLDIMLIATGFVLRILIGGEATNTHLSHWIIVMTLVLALFLALAKRRDDVAGYVETGQKARKNIQGYNMEFLNVAITMMATAVVVCYVMYCTSPEIVSHFGENTYLTSFFVILGVLRYLQLTFVWRISGSPTTVLLENRFLQVILLGWIISFFLIIYLKI
ncbi:UbiA prenyltransferase family protein [Pedobacter hartonius]|uniref:4-hydroxybenzoate polyprenyltransferase n=1 Tax=Pedobacter hartonius TaxID=425514 RepID=A0A1H4GHS5_9SPHI|nr:UbiA prenyltransferase family protein [Pedobacter hartonius]SEB09156.1 4-hydroxybenzoate polyprenyltransferase [Pedobacter hartonius]